MLMSLKISYRKHYLLLLRGTFIYLELEVYSVVFVWRACVKVKLNNCMQMKVNFVTRIVISQADDSYIRITSAHQNQ